MPPLKQQNRGGLYIGIDPGASGGIAVLGFDKSYRCSSMPETEADMWRLLNPWTPSRIANSFAVIEQVSGFIGTSHPGSAMFKFGVSYGGLRMALVAASIPFEAVTPQRWQKALGITKRAKDESKSEFKNRLKARAQQLFPSIKVTLATADALLIAEYCKRFREGTLR